jgi:hypothetical protein
VVHHSLELLIDENEDSVAAMQSALASLHKMQGAGVECFVVMLNLVELMNEYTIFISFLSGESLSLQGFWRVSNVGVAIQGFTTLSICNI